MLEGTSEGMLESIFFSPLDSCFENRIYLQINYCNKDLETAVWCAATQVQLEPTSTKIPFANGKPSPISKYTGVMQAAQVIVREEGIRVC